MRADVLAGVWVAVAELGLTDRGNGATVDVPRPLLNVGSINRGGLGVGQVGALLRTTGRGLGRTSRTSGTTVGTRDPKQRPTVISQSDRSRPTTAVVHDAQQSFAQSVDAEVDLR